MARTPRACGIDRTRWSLAALRGACVWLVSLSLAGVHRILRRLGIHWKRGRAAVRSPDPNYHPKRDDIATVVAQAQAAVAPAAPVHAAPAASARDDSTLVMLAPLPVSARIVTVYLDEVTIERQPSVSQDYQAAGRPQPRATRSWSANAETRIIATLDHCTGQVVFQRGRVTTAALVRFFQQVRAAYPAANRINVVLDNWPVHFHPDVLVALQPQLTRWDFPRPASWSDQPSAAAVRKWSQLQLPIQFVPLPTYASWLNPIEKLWRKLRQEVTHHHPWANDLPRLRDELERFLMQFAHGSADLLRYVGLKAPD